LLASVLLFAKKENENVETIDLIASKISELKLRRNLALAEKKSKSQNWYAVKQVRFTMIVS
jgi:hypothetical protein